MLKAAESLGLRGEHEFKTKPARIHSAKAPAMENVILPGKEILVLGMGGKEEDGGKYLPLRN